jgi:pimeloyl-ACP methyl ester carboxylesterase
VSFMVGATRGGALAAVLGLSLGLLQIPASSAVPIVEATSTFTPTLNPVGCANTGDDDTPAPTTCFELTVPLDWRTPDDGRTVKIAVAVTPAKRNPGRQGLTWNPGGPGVSSMDNHLGFYDPLPPSIKGNFDWVSWDPRGVGRSGPDLTDCEWSVPTGLDQPAATGPVDWEVFWQASVDFGDSASIVACFEANPDAAPYLGTWQVVRDMEALRVALGYDTWNFWGMSYGTRIGNTYARTFPDKLRALVLEGAMMANATNAREGATLPGGLFLGQQVYASIAGRKQAHKIRKILSFLDDSIIQFDGTTWNRWDAFEALHSSLAYPTGGYGNARTLVNRAYAAVRAYRAGATVSTAWQSQPAGVTGDGKTGFLMSFVACADLHDRPTVAQVAAISEQAKRTYGTAFGWRSIGDAAACLGLPSDYSPPSSNGDSTVHLSTPPLFLLTAGDTETPWMWGRSLANTYAGSRVVTWNSTWHAPFFWTPSSCVKDAAEKYLLTLALPKADKYCPYAPPATKSNKEK